MHNPLGSGFFILNRKGIGKKFFGHNLQGGEE